jgi:integrase
MAKIVGKLLDTDIKQHIKNNVRFDAKADGAGLYLRYRETDTTPVFFFRFKLAGAENKMMLGKYPDLSLSKARTKIVGLRAELIKGNNPANDLKEKKRIEAAEALARKSASTVGELVEYLFTRKIDGKCKTAKAMRQRINKHLIPAIGSLKIIDVLPIHIQSMLNDITDAGAPTSANDVLSFSKQLFNQAIKNHTITHNPASAFDIKDAGGSEPPRQRFLAENEIVALFSAMNECEKFTRQHYLVTKLLLLLGCRKGELFKAKRSDFDLIGAVWVMSVDNKTESALTIPLVDSALAIVSELLHFQVENNTHLLPSRGSREIAGGHIDSGYLNKPIRNNLQPIMGFSDFTIHDLRRTMRTHLGKLGVDRFVAERCLNHTIPNMEGVYDAGDYLLERRTALQLWSDFLEQCEAKC